MFAGALVADAIYDALSSGLVAAVLRSETFDMVQPVPPDKVPCVIVGMPTQTGGESLAESISSVEVSVPIDIWTVSVSPQGGEDATATLSDAVTSIVGAIQSVSGVAIFPGSIVCDDEGFVVHGGDIRCWRLVAKVRGFVAR
jgi:hypothetical protein